MVSLIEEDDNLNDVSRLNITNILEISPVKNKDKNDLLNDLDIKMAGYTNDYHETT